MDQGGHIQTYVTLGFHKYTNYAHIRHFLFYIFSMHGHLQEKTSFYRMKIYKFGAEIHHFKHDK